MTRRLAEAAIRLKHWQPYVKGHWMTLGGRARGGVVISFVGHESFEYRCSHKTANEILALAGKQEGGKHVTD